MTEKSIYRLWLLVAAGILSALLFLSATWLDVKPVVSPDFFFGSDDAELAEAKRINDLFPAEEFLILQVSTDNIRSPEYLRSIRDMTNRLDTLAGFNRLLSLSSGPEDVEAALKSPFWRPLLIGEDGKSSLIIAFLPRHGNEQLTAVTIEIAEDYKTAPGVEGIYISGMPYITYQIQQSILKDVSLFSVIAVLVFALLIGFLFRSVVIPISSIVSGFAAVMLTMLLLQLVGQPFGILTANLAIIVFVLVQSQAIYLTNNFLTASGSSFASRLIATYRVTLPAAFLCALTTMLGFLSLLLVSAEPLRQLGVGGSIGVVSSFVSSFLLYPVVLSKVTVQRNGGPAKVRKTGGRSVLKPVFMVALSVAAMASVYGAAQLKWDPSLFSYFEDESDIKSGLVTIDENGGSSPLQLVVSLKTGETLDTGRAYEKLWSLHQALEAHESVGTVLSLPALLAEANNHPLAFLVPWQQMVTLLQLDVNQSVADSFLDEDRKQSLFLLRMYEQGRDQPRREIVSELQEIANDQGFRVQLTGGVYYLQGYLAGLVLQSLIEGVIFLLCSFAVLAAIIMRSVRVALIMGVAASLIPLISIGTSGYLHMPLDIISAPAFSVAFGIAVDALLHLGLAYRRAIKGQAAEPIKVALAEQGKGILGASVVIFCGFSVLFLSEFPPTIRFGFILMMGAFIAALVSLILFPALLSRTQKSEGITN
ncbi:MMPL family transporter [Sneathiella sp. P13V-1]|uniref:efflux RND transporter permease subunit n=1 Tax=Sneathiella sp. P13V-1 TaxID=2697366 RepID=UPI00187B8981|nr:MMPL family transporter [Sneathiella sp. P13V-1]MBE7638149.1 MMPL family transporter [Sneathiella sp. P13V-1]